MAIPKRDAPLERDGYAEKAIAFPILTLASLEKPCVRRRALRVRDGLEFANNIAPPRDFSREFVVFRRHADPVQEKLSERANTRGRRWRVRLRRYRSRRTCLSRRLATRRRGSGRAGCTAWWLSSLP